MTAPIPPTLSLATISGSAYEQIGEFEKAAEAARHSLSCGSKLGQRVPALWPTPMPHWVGPTRLGRRSTKPLKQFPNSESTCTGLPCGWRLRSISRMRLNAVSLGQGQARRVQLSRTAGTRPAKRRETATVERVDATGAGNGKKPEPAGDRVVAIWANSAVIQADFGVCEQARQNVATIPTGKTRDADVFAGFVFATCGEAAKAEIVASEFGKNYPLDTLVQKLAIPQIRARIELQHGNSAKAIEQLRPTEAYQFGYIAAGMPAYLRGLAYLQAKQGPQAAAEFQKLLDHKPALGASPYVSLARLGLARGLVLSGDAAKARTAYQDFFSEWKDADPNIPILKEARAEYAKLQ